MLGTVLETILKGRRLAGMELAKPTGAVPCGERVIAMDDKEPIFRPQVIVIACLLIVGFTLFVL